MLSDVEYFDSRISKLDGAGGLGPHIVNVVKAKPIITMPKSPQTVAFEPNETTQSESDVQQAAIEGKDGSANK